LKALTMTQPWASLLVAGANRIETRSWNTRYRGPVAIHAAAGFPSHAKALCAQSPYREALAAAGFAAAADLPTGRFIGVADLEEVVACDGSSAADIRRQSRAGTLPPHEADFGDFSAGRFGFVMVRMAPLATQLPARGMLGLWNVAPAVEEQILAAALDAVRP
jgi:hypothetical protein